MSKNLYIKTYGCQMNERDSEIAEQLLALEGYGTTDNPDEADVILINTCSIREKAAQKVYSLLGQLREAKAKSRPCSSAWPAAWPSRTAHRWPAACRTWT